MKKLFVIVTMFVCAFSTEANAQTAQTPQPANAKPIAKPAPGTKAYDALMKLDGVPGESKVPSKPVPPKTIAKPTPGKKAAFMKYEVLKAQ